MSIVMTGGGTGGHLVIIKAVKEELADKELVYIGSTGGQDQEWFSEDDEFANRYFLETRGVVNQGVTGKLKSLFMLFKAIKEAMRLLDKYKAKVVFSVGGFSAAPAAIAAKIKGIPLVIHEQNAAIGSLNKLLKPFAAAFISSYLPESPIHAYPVKQQFFDNARVRKEVKTVIFLGGSQGAKAINKLALEIAPELHRRGIKIIHQAGEKNIDEVRGKYREAGIEAEVFGFTTKIASLMNEADLAVARAGASTLWELSATGLPALFIPYPYAAGDHQYYNARFFAKQNLSWVMREEEIDIGKVIALLDTDLESKSRGLIDAVEKEGSQRIANLLKKIANDV